MTREDLGDIQPWVSIHGVCIVVSANTVVRWNSASFDAHPLRGGVTPTPDAANPIEVAGPGIGTTPVDVTFAAAGTFPYYCDVHLTNMRGVVYVD